MLSKLIQSDSIDENVLDSNGSMGMGMGIGIGKRESRTRMRMQQQTTFRLCTEELGCDGTMIWLYWIYTDMDHFRGRHLSYQRGKRNTTPGTSLIQIEGVNNTEAAKYVLQRYSNTSRF